MRDHVYERIKFEDPPGECWLVQYAVDGELGPPFWLHKSYKGLLQTNEQGFWDAVKRCADSALASSKSLPHELREDS